MVVVFGAVGSLWGTLIGGMSLSIVKAAGAVFGDLSGGQRDRGADRRPG
jgi:uncharacterized membrane protein